MLMMLVLDELLVYGISLDAFRAKSVRDIRNDSVAKERDGRTAAKATGRNHVGTARRNLRYVDQRSPQQRASA